MLVPKQQDQGGHTKARLSRPNLTLDTQRPIYPVSSDPCAQSAPVGTRQEKGIAPMYQAGDRHCAKLAEMMDSPTWRSQNVVPYMGRQHIQRPVQPHEGDAQAIHYQEQTEAVFIGTNGLPQQTASNSRSIDEVLHLGRCGDDIEILGIQPFLESSDTSNNTFIISAAISQEALRRYAPFGGDGSRYCEGSPHSSLSSVSYSGAIQKIRQEKGQKLGDNAQKVMDRDDAIQSINHSLRSPNRRRQVTSDEQQRFRGLIDRLHQRREEETSKEAASFVDPAIIAFVPKKAGPSTPTKQSTRNRSDSGYASPSGYSRPGTRAQTRVERETSGSADLEVIRIEHQKGGSHDSGFDESPSKNSILNPTAREFLVPRTSKFSPAKSGLSIRSSVSSKLFVPPNQEFQRTLGAPLAPQTCPTMHPSQGAWYPPQSDINISTMAFGPMHQGVLPGVQPNWNNATGASIPSAAGMNPMGLPGFSGPVSGLGQAPGFDLAGLITSCGLGAANVPGPFHQQLSGLGLCCNPTHQAMSTFHPPALHGVVPQAAPQISGPSVTLPGLTPSAVSFVPKHVPKPKVPNTTGQQNWELMHELRRMNEPGYAQKCKEKQKKRYMKQLEKTGGES